MAKKSAEKRTHSYAVKFGGVSIGENTAKISITIARSSISLAAADKLFCGHRLSGYVELTPPDALDGQATLVDDLNPKIDGSFDCKGLRVTTDSIATGLTFSLPDINLVDLASMSKGQGKVVVDSVAEIPQGGDEE